MGRLTSFVLYIVLMFLQLSSANETSSDEDCNCTISDQVLSEMLDTMKATNETEVTKNSGELDTYAKEILGFLETKGNYLDNKIKQNLHPGNEFSPSQVLELQKEISMYKETINILKTNCQKKVRKMDARISLLESQLNAYLLTIYQLKGDLIHIHLKTGNTSNALNYTDPAIPTRIIAAVVTKLLNETAHSQHTISTIVDYLDQMPFCELKIKALEDITDQLLLRSQTKNSTVFLLFNITSQCFPRTKNALTKKDFASLFDRHYECGKFSGRNLSPDSRDDKLAAIKRTENVKEILDRFPNFLQRATAELMTCSTPNSPRRVSNTRCGAVLTEADGEITYRPESQTAENERCIWTVVVPGADKYRIAILDVDSEINQQNGNKLLVISDQTFSTSILPTCDTLEMISARALIVTFATGANVTASKGFKFVYRAPVDAFTSNSQNGSHYIIRSGILKYPTGSRSTYSNYELSTFAFVPHFIFSGSGAFTFTFTRYGMEHGCHDQIFYYKFNYLGVTSNDRYWDNGTMICGRDESRKDTHGDVIFAVFYSDYSNVGKGFSLAQV